jgi:hypothetical protein
MTTIDEKSLQAAYEDVRSDTSDTAWALFKFDGNTITHYSSGSELDELKGMLDNDERAFAYLRVQSGDELSKRSKFVLVTYVGSDVSTLKRARMSIDKALVKQVLKNFAVELQIESQEEISDEQLKDSVRKAGGANYGTGAW